MAQFRAKARAVDLLGKGQIADLPTAISELWKNGYDAYGDNLEATIYIKGYQDLEEPVFVVSDDGKGMSREDILEKWFVLGTDSKSRHDQKDIKGPDTLDKEPRIKMGEKGIGRLAVAYLGPQMLMLTKKPNYPLEAVFFDWRILENYDLFLGDVNIPIMSVDSVSSFSNVLHDLKLELLQNFPDLNTNDKDPWEDQKSLKHNIIDDCVNLKFADFLIGETISDLFSSAQTHATRFLIFKPDDQILELRDLYKKDEQQQIRDDPSGKHTLTSLAGLFNYFTPDIKRAKTAIWVNQNNEGRYNIFDFRQFFEPGDFELGDHLIEGEFDEFGTFKGKIRIYKKEVIHEFTPSTKPKTKKSAYGPLRFKLGYIAGEDETLLRREQYSYLVNKLQYYGGLYIYRDGFRVLPYGRTDNDFLEFEERRGRSAGDHFFSKRRMFGYLEITRDGNPKLIDKSSREGFVTNVASRELKSDLIAFFKDLAKKYYATHAQYDYKETQRKEIVRLAESEKKELEKDKQARKEFAKKLSDLPKELSKLEKEYLELMELLKLKNNESQLVYEEIQDLLLKIENCKVRISDYELQKPVRFKPTELQEKNFHNYSKSFQKVQNEIKDSSKLLNSIRDKLKIHELFQEYLAQQELYKNRLESQFFGFSDQLNKVFNKIKAEFDAERSKFIKEFSAKSEEILPTETDPVDISNSMGLLTNIFTEIQQRSSERVGPYMEHLNRLSFEVNEDNLVGFYKDQFTEMKKEWEQTYELAQLGIAVEIIDHQFNTLYSQLAESIRSLKAQLLNTNEASRKYNNLSLAFEHLLDNYRLLQPLYRITGRARKEVTGKELKEYVEDFFRTRLVENKIRFEITPAAEKWSVYSYESIFKPVLINIVNNALYWLQSSSDRLIKIDVVDDKLLVMNSGEPIEDYMLDDIFKLFYSGRPNGRGIGLYLAKQSLNGIGFEIEATNDVKLNRLKGACFVITKVN